jgi:hypothetical protein
MRDELFPQSNGNTEQETHQREKPPNDSDRKVADESVRQADGLDAHAVRSIGEPNSFPSERAEPPPVVTVSAEEPSASEPTDDSERLGRVFEILRDRLGLSS